MLRIRFATALAGAAVAIAAAVAISASAQTTMAPTPGPVVGPSAAPSTTSHPASLGAALDARSLRARRTKTGYTLTGQALVNDACRAARFDRFLGDVFPPQFNLNQFRRPGTRGLFCVQRLTWVTATPETVTSTASPPYATVRTKKGFTRAPVL
jgi:hypothetical protein